MDSEKVLEKDKIILAYYIDVREVNENEIPDFMHGVLKKIQSKLPVVGEIIALPVRSETRVECINPKYITEPELIREHRLKMDEVLEIMSRYIDEEKDGREKEVE